MGGAPLFCKFQHKKWPQIAKEARPTDRPTVVLQYISRDSAAGVASAAALCLVTERIASVVVEAAATAAAVSDFTSPEAAAAAASE